MRILDATDEDVPALLAIYNHAIVNTTAIWTETLATLEDRRDWLSQRQAEGFPVLIARNDVDQVVGYASYGSWRAWQGYRHTIEHSVYTHPSARGLGVGTALLNALVDHAGRSGHHVMVAGIEATNVPSLRLHQSCGFKDAGTLRQVGTKFGRWLDLTFMQRILSEPNASRAIR